MTEEDEIQKEILKLLPSFVNLIGGSYHAHLLMDIVFDYLYKCDDSNAKEIALNAAKDLFRKIDLRHFQKLLMDFMNRSNSSILSISFNPISNAKKHATKTP